MPTNKTQTNGTWLCGRPYIWIMPINWDKNLEVKLMLSSWYGLSILSQLSNIGGNRCSCVELYNNSGFQHVCVKQTLERGITISLEYISAKTCLVQLKGSLRDWKHCINNSSYLSIYCTKNIQMLVQKSFATLLNNQIKHNMGIIFQGGLTYWRQMNYFRTPSTSRWFSFRKLSLKQADRNDTLKKTQTKIFGCYLINAFPVVIETFCLVPNYKHDLLNFQLNSDQTCYVSIVQTATF